MTLGLSKNPYRQRYNRLVSLLQDFKEEEHIDNEILFKYLQELLKKWNY